MFTQEVSTLSFWVVAIMMCVVLLIIVAQISHFYSLIKGRLKDHQGQMLAIMAQQKQLQTTLSEILGETRRGNRLSLEMIELKQAEMTGEYDIVEEPVKSPANTASASAEAPKTPAPQVNLSAPPRNFPKL